MIWNVLRDLHFSGDQPLQPAADRYVQLSFGMKINKINNARIMVTVIG